MPPLPPSPSFWIFKCCKYEKPKNVFTILSDFAPPPLYKFSGCACIYVVYLTVMKSSTQKGCRLRSRNLYLKYLPGNQASYVIGLFKSSHEIKRLLKRVVKAISTNPTFYEVPIHNGTHEAFIRLILWKISTFFYSCSWLYQYNEDELFKSFDC